MTDRGESIPIPCNGRPSPVIDSTKRPRKWIDDSAFRRIPGLPRGRQMDGKRAICRVDSTGVIPADEGARLWVRSLEGVILMMMGSGWLKSPLNVAPI